MRWASPDEDARAFFVEQLRLDPDARGWWTWVAERNDDGADVGGGGFGGPPGPNRRLTVGYSIHPEFRCRGYATEVLELLTQWALAQRNIDVVRATIAPANAASLRVAEKAGFAATGERVLDDEHGELLVLERRRQPSRSSPSKARIRSR